MNEADVNQVAASAIADLIKSSFSRIADGASKQSQKAWDKIFRDFKPYMEDCYNKNSNVRILSQKDRDVYLPEIYVNSNFRSSGKIYTDQNLMQSLSEGTNIVVTGNGGSGKTFFMRHLWLTFFSNHSDTTPIFIELRKINDLTNVDLESFVRRSISSKKELTQELFSYFCKNGRFCFIFDGFDEVVVHLRDDLQTQILQLTSDYKDCPIAVSSRFEPRFAGWQNFEVYESLPFDLEQTVDLINKVPFEAASKKSFLKKLDKKFFESNVSFLSNPLLAIMMMMTFKENMEITNKMSIFYDQAFNTLFQWHDATKTYKRPKAFDISEFQRSFGTFCLLSYYNEKYSFTRSEMEEYIEKCNKICQYKQKVSDIIRDYEESVNLIRQDGLYYVFIHRSFQEYFAALALMRYYPERFSEFFPVLSQRVSDKVLPLCFEIDKKPIIDEYFSKIVKQVKSTITDFDEGDPISFLETINLCFEIRFMGKSQIKIDGKRVRPFVIRASIIEEMNIFFDVALSIYTGSDTSPHEFFDVDIFDQEIIEIVREINHYISEQEASSIIDFLEIRFKNKKISYEIGYDEEYIEKDDFSEFNLPRSIVRRRKPFAQVSEKIHNKGMILLAWAEKEISSVKKERKNIDEMFGLS